MVNAVMINTRLITARLNFMLMPLSIPLVIHIPDRPKLLLIFLYFRDNKYLLKVVELGCRDQIA